MAGGPLSEGELRAELEALRAVVRDLSERLAANEAAERERDKALTLALGLEPGPRHAAPASPALRVIKGLAPLAGLGLLAGWQHGTR